MEYTPKSDGRTADYLIIGFFAVAVCAFAVSSSGYPVPPGLVQNRGARFPDRRVFILR